jgi:O-acetyl-ADP-ribose deacetylase (regulator of RNase III)
MYEHAAANNITRIAIPKIGSGIGGMDWEDVEEMISLAWMGSKYEIQIVVYEL